MKTIVPLRKLIIVSCAAATIALLGSHGAANAKQTPMLLRGIRDTILISKKQSSKKHKIRLYPNADNKVIFFSASGEPGKVYQLFLFDMDGKLFKQIQIRNKETTVLTNMVKGDYLFEVFSDDERIENGHVAIR